MKFNASSALTIRSRPHIADHNLVVFCNRVLDLDPQIGKPLLHLCHHGTIAVKPRCGAFGTIVVQKARRHVAIDGARNAPIHEVIETSNDKALIAFRLADIRPVVVVDYRNAKRPPIESDRSLRRHVSQMRKPCSSHTLPCRGPLSGHPSPHRVVLRCFQKRCRTQHSMALESVQCLEQPALVLRLDRMTRAVTHRVLATCRRIQHQQ